MGAVASLNSLMAVVAPVIGAPLLAHRVAPAAGRLAASALPFYFCAALQARPSIARLAPLHAPPDRAGARRTEP